MKPGFAEGLIAPGQVIKAGGEKYVIDSISEADPPVVSVKPAPASAVSAASNYSIALPSLQRGPFKAAVRLAGNASLEAEGDLTATLTLAPRGHLPAWEIV